MLTNWMIFGACALIGTSIVAAIEKAKAKKTKKTTNPEEDLTMQLLRSNARKIEEWEKKSA